MNSLLLTITENKRKKTDGSDKRGKSTDTAISRKRTGRNMTHIKLKTQDYEQSGPTKKPRVGELRLYGRVSSSFLLKDISRIVHFQSGISHLMGEGKCFIVAKPPGGESCLLRNFICETNISFTEKDCGVDRKIFGATHGNIV